MKKKDQMDDVWLLVVGEEFLFVLRRCLLPLEASAVELSSLEEALSSNIVVDCGVLRASFSCLFSRRCRRR